MDNSSRSYSDSLKTTLNCYQLTSADSLSGPSSFSALAAHLWYKENNSIPPSPRPPIVQIPLLIPKDTSTKRAETTLSGHVISCFIVGGEMRLCLPQILNSVLKNFSITEINRTCAELYIYCSRCSPDQLEILKVLGILPFNTSQCGLITKTDAERLVSALESEYDLNGKQDFNMDKLKGIPVYHECFGNGEGVFYPDLYTERNARCIACLDCRITFSPDKFISHSHRSFEKRVCHWGFDRDNWRHYLLVPRNMNENKYKEFEKQLNNAKLRFDVKAQAEALASSVNNLKRRMKTESGATEVNSKKIKSEKNNNRKSPSSDSLGFSLPMRSAFKPWSGGLPPNLFPLQDANLLKTYESLLQDRGFLPRLLQATSPSQKPEWPLTSLPVLDLPKALVVPPNRDSENKPQQNGKHPQNKAAFIKTEGTPENGFYPEPYRRISNESNPCSGVARKASEVRSASDPSPAKDISSTGLELRKHCSFDSAVPQVAEVLNLKQAKNLDEEESFPESCSRKSLPQKDNRPSTERSAAVAAAASAMLQLSSSGEDQAPFRSRNTSHDYPTPLNSTSGVLDCSGSASFPKIIPVDSDENLQEWLFRDCSFVLGAQNTKQIALFHQLLIPIVTDQKQQEELLKEIVRIKHDDQEKLNALKRSNDELTEKLEGLKLSNTHCIKEVSDVKKEFRHDLELARNSFHDQIKEANDSLVSLGKSVADMRLHPDCHEGRDLIQHKILDRLHRQVDDKEEALRQLEGELLDERDRRLAAESHVKELNNVLSSRDRATENNCSTDHKPQCNVIQSSSSCNSLSPSSNGIKSGNTTPSKSLIRSMLSTPAADSRT